MNKLCTHIVIHESFSLWFISKIVARLEEAEAPYFMKNTFASGSSKSHMLPTSFPLPASFFKVLPLPQKFNSFRFHITGLHITIWLSITAQNIYRKGTLKRLRLRVADNDFFRLLHKIPQEVPVGFICLLLHAL